MAYEAGKTTEHTNTIIHNIPFTGIYYCTLVFSARWHRQFTRLNISSD